MSAEGILLFVAFPTIIVVGVITELIKWDYSYKKQLKKQKADNFKSES